MRKNFLLVLWLAMGASAAEKCATVWTGSIHGPYPVGNPVAQPELHGVFPGASANDQTFRLILKPDLWSGKVRLRFSNVLGSRALRLDDVYVGVHASAGRLLPGTNRPVRFGHEGTISIEAGRYLWSDPVNLAYFDRG